jgi:hypothetical protein
MKKVYSFLLSFSFILLFASQVAANKDGTILMTAQLSPGQEVPAVTNAPNARGLVTIVLEEDRSLTINGVFDGLSGAVDKCHFHKGVTGVSGGVVLDLKPFVTGNRIYGKIASPTKALIEQLLTDSIYVNVHTTLNGGGEIRGQVLTQTDYHFWTILSGAFEVPGVNTQALGLASVVVSRFANNATTELIKVDYKIVVNGLTGGAITGAHFHKGLPTATGPVAYALTVNGNVIAGSINVTRGFVDSLASGLVYVNVHTTNFANGEIRGQMGWVNGAIGFDALLEGSNEVPPVTTSAKGLAIAWANDALDTLQYAVLYTGLTPSAAHFHGGPITGTGGVITALTPYTIQGITNTNAYVARIPWTQQNLIKLLKDSVYVNIHTTTPAPGNPNGEIRGQMLTSLHGGVVANLCSKQELSVAATTPTTGIGAGFASIDRNKQIGELGLFTNGLSGNITSAHFHKGAIGVNGPVYLNFGATTTNAYAGFFTFPTTSGADSLRDGLMYFNVHTALNAGGEIRGQAGASKFITADCLLSSTFELNGEKLFAKVFPNPTHESINLVFGSNQAFDAEIAISDIVGRTVSVKNFKVEDGENQLPISVSNLSNGLYFIQLKNKGKIIFSEKIVKE